jgi:hypothetical protein
MAVFAVWFRLQHVRAVWEVGIYKVKRIDRFRAE